MLLAIWVILVILMSLAILMILVILMIVVTLTISVILWYLQVSLERCDFGGRGKCVNSTTLASEVQQVKYIN